MRVRYVFYYIQYAFMKYFPSIIFLSKEISVPVISFPVADSSNENLARVIRGRGRGRGS